MRSESYSTWSVSVCYHVFYLHVQQTRHQRVQCYTGLVFKIGDFPESTAFKSYGVKTE